MKAMLAISLIAFTSVTLAQDVCVLIRSTSQSQSTLTTLNLTTSTQVFQAQSIGAFFQHPGVYQRHGSAVYLAGGGQGEAAKVQFLSVDSSSGKTTILGEVAGRSTLGDASQSIMAYAPQDIWSLHNGKLSKILSVIDYNSIIAPSYCNGAYVVSCDNERIYFIGQILPSQSDWNFGLFSCLADGADLRFDLLPSPEGYQYSGTLQSLCVGGGNVFFSNGSDIFSYSLQSKVTTLIYSIDFGGIADMDWHDGRLYLVAGSSIESILQDGSDSFTHYTTGGFDGLALSSIDIYSCISGQPDIEISDKNISFHGYIETSTDLHSWSLLSPQPPSPFEIETSEGRTFYRATKIRNE